MSALARITALTALLGLTAGCVSAPEPATSPVPLPPNYLAAHNAESEAFSPWWHSFHDEQLNQFVSQTLLQNPTLAQAIARTRIAQARAQISNADRLPQLGLGLTSARQRLLAPAGHSTGESHSASLDVSWELDIWGRLAAQTAASQADFKASQEQLRSTEQSISAEVVRLYFNLIHARAQAKLAHNTARTYGEVARQIDNRVAAGIASPADGMLARANLASAQASYQQRQESLERVTRQLEIMQGQYPSGQLASADDLPAVPLPPATGLPAQLLLQRPDIQAAEWSLQAAGYRLKAAQRSFLPNLSLSGSAGSSAADIANLFSGNTFVWSVAGRLLQPVYQGGRLRANLALSEGQQDEVLAAYAETVLRALAEVETSLAIEQWLAEREHSLAISADNAEQAMQVAYNRYLQGIDPYLMVLESQQRALDSRSAQITAHHARLDNRITLHLALGGGFAPQAPAAQGVEHE